MLARADALAALADEPFDVLVIGGGITGAGVALDAASRGYSVALVEKGDYARGTSSRSSKLIHGGLRYLQTFDLGLVREALLERQLLAALAPHLVRPLPFVVPAFDGARPDRILGIGLNAYDVMAVDRRRRRRSREDDWSPERHRIIDGAEVLELLPALAGREPTGGYLFYDCQTDDVTADEDRDAAACACYIVLLAAHDRGLGGYWRTPGVLRTPEGRAACGIPAGEAVLGLLHLGEARGEKPAPDRAPLDVVVTHLP